MSNNDVSSLRLHLVGCGKMGSALLKSWLNAGVQPSHITARIASSASADMLVSLYGIDASTQMAYNGEDVVLLAVKPQMLDQVLAEQWHPAPMQPLYISIAAGKPLSYFMDRLGDDARIIRAMPNTPALVGRGVTTLVAAQTAKTSDRKIAERLFSSCGNAIWLDSETQLDAATALAGSGPAYVFFFAECLLSAALQLGLPEDTALALVKGTLAGSIALADAEGWGDLAELRHNVTSKGGVTQAALAVLMPELPGLIERMLEANIARAKALN